jgi:signal transduction histidine kinase
VGGMLALFSALRERSRDRFARLASWPNHQIQDQTFRPFADFLAHAATVLKAPRILVLWEEADEPDVSIAVLQDGRYEQMRDAPETFNEFVHHDLTKSAFATEDVTKNVFLKTGVTRAARMCIDEELRRRFSVVSTSTAPFKGLICAGRVFILDRKSWNDTDLLLTEIIASRFGNELDFQAVRIRNEVAVATRERLRIIRDVHDGVLQSLAAAVLQLQLLAAAPKEEVDDKLAVIKTLLSNEQRRIREFVQALETNASSQEPVSLRQRLEQLISEIGQHWGCSISFSVSPDDLVISRSLAVQVSLMLSEAIANAVRHGAASEIDVAIKWDADLLIVTIRDNGRGFAGADRKYDHAELVELGLGPVSLRERARDLGGSLTLLNLPSGAEVQIRVPAS